MYAIYRTARFDKELTKKFSKNEQKEVEKFEKKQLTNNPFIGDGLSFNFFREKRIGGKRVYFIVYEELKAVLMVAVSDKKTQQETIDEIKDHLSKYYEIIKEAIKQHDESGHS